MWWLFFGLMLPILNCRSGSSPVCLLLCLFKVQDFDNATPYGYIPCLTAWDHLPLEVFFFEASDKLSFIFSVYVNPIKGGP